MENREVTEQVLDEIKKVGATTAENYDELRSGLAKLRSDIDANEGKVDSLLTLKLDRMATEVATRQDEMDKAFAEQKAIADSATARMDELDVLVQRHAAAGDIDPKEFDAELKAFALSTLPDNQAKGNNVTARIEELRSQYPEYKKAFDRYLRVNGRETDLSPEDRKALSVGSEPDGGFAVTPYMSTRIVERMYESSPIRSLASVETITSDAYESLVDKDDSTTVGWESETIAGDETNTPKMGKLRIPVHVLYARPAATQQLLEDAGINVESWLATKAGDKMGRTEATAFVSGDGIGKPRGILSYGTGTTWGTVEQVAMGNATALTADGFSEVKYALKEMYLNRGTWLLNRDTVKEAMQLKDGSGAYIWKPSLIASDPTATILGAPVRMATDMPTVAANALSVVYADFREAFLVVDRLGVTVIRDPYTKKPFVEFYFRKRVGGDVVNFDAIKIGKVSV